MTAAERILVELSLDLGHNMKRWNHLSISVKFFLPLNVSALLMVREASHLTAC